MSIECVTQLDKTEYTDHPSLAYTAFFDYKIEKPDHTLRLSMIRIAIPENYLYFITHTEYNIIHMWFGNLEGIFLIPLTNALEFEDEVTSAIAESDSNQMTLKISQIQDKWITLNNQTLEPKPKPNRRLTPINLTT